ncbi:MAG: HTTM domain-containing protein [Bacteroidota bacterium]
MSLLQSLRSTTDPLVLGIFRIGFGLVMAASMLRFLILGWAAPLYTEPTFHFSYPGFDWIKPLPLPYINGLLLLGIMAALAFALGRAAKWWLTVFLVIFTYLELIDATTYLNHYYFVSVLGCLLLLLPVDASLVWGKKAQPVKRWTVLFLRYQVGLVYFFAGIAKLNADWLFDAMPLQIWLPARAGLPVIGPLLDMAWTPWIMAWGGAAFDLSIAFFLASKRWRLHAYCVALGFHALTFVLFNIGVFPIVMMTAALVFFEAEEWRKAYSRICRAIRYWHASVATRASTFTARLRMANAFDPSAPLPARPDKRLMTIAVVFLVIQSLLPLRHVLYPGNRMWTEEGFRFAWHVMVAEKTGSVTYNILDPDSGNRWSINPSDELTPRQESQMSFQPDLIWQYARHLENRFRAAGYQDVEVRAEAYVSFNGRSSRLLIDPTVDLTQVQRGPGPAPWIIRYSQNL